MVELWPYYYYIFFYPCCFVHFTSKYVSENQNSRKMLFWLSDCPRRQSNCTRGQILSYPQLFRQKIDETFAKLPPGTGDCPRGQFFVGSMPPHEDRQIVTLLIIMYSWQYQSTGTRVPKYGSSYIWLCKLWVQLYPVMLYAKLTEKLEGPYAYRQRRRNDHV